PSSVAGAQQFLPPTPLPCLLSYATGADHQSTQQVLLSHTRGIPADEDLQGQRPRQSTLGSRKSDRHILRFHTSPQTIQQVFSSFHHENRHGFDKFGDTRKNRRSEIRGVGKISPGAGMFMHHALVVCSILGSVSANLKKHLATLSKRGGHRVLVGDLDYAGLPGKVYTP